VGGKPREKCRVGFFRPEEILCYTTRSQQQHISTLQPFARSSLPKMAPSAGILLELSPNIGLIGTFLAKTSEQIFSVLGQALGRCFPHARIVTTLLSPGRQATCCANEFLHLPPRCVLKPSPWTFWLGVAYKSVFPEIMCFTPK